MTRVRDFVGDGVYLFVWDDLLYIKRLQVADEEHYEMISDNPRHKDRLIRRDMTYIQARVLLVWAVLGRALVITRRLWRL